MPHDFDKRILQQLEHRPWPLPGAPWVMTQTWNDLLFAHWRMDVDAMRPHVPRHFELDVFDGSAWIGIVPFYMTNVAPRGVPSLPWVSEFPELNVRTYVRVGDRPGVYFFSLDAGSTVAVEAARMWLNLPYFLATMRITPHDGGVAYESRREDGRRAALRAKYRPVGTEFSPERGSLEYFLTERYCLYNIDHRGAPYRLDIHHPPWRLARAEAYLAENTMAEASGISLPHTTPLLHFAKRQDMVAWSAASLT